METNGEWRGYFGNRIKALRFEPPEDTFSFDDDHEDCFDQKSSGLPSGVISARRCYDGAPTAISFPHFLHGSEWYKGQKWT